MSAAAAPPAPEPQAKPKKAPVMKPEKPDQGKFEKERDAADSELKKVQDDLKAIKGKLDAAKPGGKSPRQTEIKDELRQLRGDRSGRSAAGQKLSDQIKDLDHKVKAGIAEIKATKDKLPFRSLEQLDARIDELERRIESGGMRIVEEKKALGDISNWNRQRKLFAQLDEKQAEIDKWKADAAQLREQKQDPEKKALDDKITKLQDELAALQMESDKDYKNINALRDERSRLQGLQNDKWSALQHIKDEYYQAKKAYRDYENEAYKVRRARAAEAEAEKKREHKRAIAQEKMEAASQPAFAGELLTCEGLIGFFDPESAEAARKAKHAAAPSALAAQATRKVDDSGLKGKKLVKEEEDYFIGGGGKKKGKKGGSKGSKPATPAAAAAADGESPAAAPASAGKFNMNAGVFEELSVVGVEPPANAAEVPKTLEALRAKVQWYKDNQDRVTKENIAKAKKELEKLDADEATANGNSTAGNGTATPAAEVEDKIAEKVEDKREEAIKEDAEQNPAVDAEEEAVKAAGENTSGNVE